MIEQRNEVHGPYHQRIGLLTVKHNAKVFAEAAKLTGSQSWDVGRDERTNTKDGLTAYLASTFSAETLDTAHRTVCAAYRENGGGKRFRRRNGNGGNEQGQQSEAKAEQSEAKAEQSEAKAEQSEAKAEQSEAKAEAMTDAEAEAATGEQDETDAEADDAEKAIREAAEKAIRELREKAEQAKKEREAKQRKQQAKAKSGQHKQFPTLLAMCRARDKDGMRLNIWLHGPAGTGKTTAARMIASELNLKFYANSALDTGFKLSGFIGPQGLVRTPFRDAWEHGGVYLFDEIDGSMPSALIEVNAALANGVHAFPDGMVERHPDCIVIAGANTNGLGGTAEYVARAKQDAAFLDRFCFLDWPIDEQLETELAPNKAWCKRVQQVRAKVQQRGLKGILITPRATFNGAALLESGLPQSVVEMSVLRRGMTDDQWQQVA